MAVTKSKIDLEVKVKLRRRITPAKPCVEIVVENGNLAAHPTDRRGKHARNAAVHVVKHLHDKLTFVNRTGIPGVCVAFRDTPFASAGWGPIKQSVNVGESSAPAGKYKYSVFAPGMAPLDPDVQIEN